MQEQAVFTQKTEPVPPTGRFAPSPSGRMHLGNVFSALLAWLSVQRAGGVMVRPPASGQSGLQPAGVAQRQKPGRTHRAAH